MKNTIKEILFPNSVKEENILREVILSNSLRETEKKASNFKNKEKVFKLYFP